MKFFLTTQEILCYCILQFQLNIWHYFKTVASKMRTSISMMPKKGRPFHGKENL